jgi:hypothetical protein
MADLGTCGITSPWMCEFSVQRHSGRRTHGLRCADIIAGEGLFQLFGKIEADTCEANPALVPARSRRTDPPSNL